MPEHVEVLFKDKSAMMRKLKKTSYEEIVSNDGRVAGFEYRCARARRQNLSKQGVLNRISRQLAGDLGW